MQITNETQDVTVKIPMTREIREKWDRFVRARGYARGPLLRSFIEAITDQARGPRLEAILRDAGGAE
jgi:hypothetical protein